MKEPMKYKKKLLTYMLYIFLFFVLIFPFYWALIYVLPAADDFSFSGDVQRFGGHDIRSLLNMVKDSYVGWQGSFFGIFLVGAVDPLRRFGINGISIFLIIILIIFMAMITRLVCLFLKQTYQNTADVTILISILLIAGCLNVRLPKEVFFWYTGTCTYMVPLLCGFLGIMLLLKYWHSNEKSKNNYFLLTGSAFLGFLASGGILQITGFICWCYLLFLIFAFVKKRKVKTIGIVFFIVLTGAFINALAPGNFARQEMTYESVSIFKAVYYTLVTVGNEIKYIFSETYIPWLLLTFTILAFLYHKPINEKLYHPVIIGITVIFSWCISTFPVCFGYGSSAIEQRGYIILDLFIVLGLFLFINSLVNYIKTIRKVILTRENITIIFIFSIIMIGYLQISLPAGNIPSLRCLQKLVSGEAQHFSNDWKETLQEIESSDESIVKVELDRSLLDKDMIFLFPELSENPEKWVNGAVAIFYGKDRLDVSIEEEE